MARVPASSPRMTGTCISGVAATPSSPFPTLKMWTVSVQYNNAQQELWRGASELLARNADSPWKFKIFPLMIRPLEIKVCSLSPDLCDERFYFTCFRDGPCTVVIQKAPSIIGPQDDL